MANDCEFIMKIVGEKRDCEEFISRMQYYENPYHFHRIFNVDVSDYQYEDKSCYAFGTCAWSLESCCRASGYSNGTDLFSVNTKDLNLKIEAYSREPGMGFEEHYIYDKGCCLTDECLEFCLYYWDKSYYETYEKYIKDNPDAPDEEYFDENGEAIVGGFGEEYGIWNISCNDESDEPGESMEEAKYEELVYSETDDYHDVAHEDSIEENDPISEFFKAFEEAKSALIQTEN